jgi:transposase
MLEAEIRRLLAQVQQEPPRPDPLETQISSLQTAVQLLDTIPGIDELTTSTLVAEMGTNMDQFPSSRHLASWAGFVSRQ